MPINASNAGARANHGDLQTTAKGNFSWRALHDETQTARQDRGASLFFQTIIGGLLVGTEMGQPIGASNGEPGNTTKDVDPLGSALKEEKIDYEKDEFGAMRQEAAPRYDAAMDNMGKGMWIGLASGSTHIGENIVRAELAQIDLAIKDLTKEISDQQQKENDLQNGAKAHEEETSAAIQNLEKAVGSLNQIESAIGSVLGEYLSRPTTQSQGSHDEATSQPFFELPAMTSESSHHWPL